MKPNSPPRRSLPLTIVLLIVLLGSLWMLQSRQVGTSRVSWSEMVQAVQDDRIESMVITPTEIRAKAFSTTTNRPRTLTTQRLPDVDLEPFLAEAEGRGVGLEGRTSGTLARLLVWLPPLLLLLFIGLPLLLNKARQSRGFGLGQIEAFDGNSTPEVTFADVAGVDEAKGELQEVIDFLVHPDRYEALGARLPKGTLLVGPPGTGKTLLAKAVAGEANVPFFAIAGSEFVEMFVGVGASRVRELFEKAKQNAPCIVFIDELDAIGRARGGHAALGVNEEREQTLNQLLVEMDGFEPRSGVVILAATNRPEVIDAALLRAGRFDRRVVLDRPDVKGREQILKVHARKISLGRVALHAVAQRTIGMVGADLARVVNEAALAAVRRSSKTVDDVDFEEAIDRLQLGLERKRLMNAEEKKRIAYHESGHTLVAMSVDHADPVHRVTVVPRTIGALGLTLQLPTTDRYLITEPELLDQITVLLGGRAAEDEAFGTVSSGAENDLERATAIARRMVSRFGMSAVLGTGAWGEGESQYLTTPGLGRLGRETGAKTADTVDDEVRRILTEQYHVAKEILETHRAALDALASRLQQEETLERAQIEAIVGHTRAQPPSSGPPLTILPPMNEEFS